MELKRELICPHCGSTTAAPVVIKPGSRWITATLTLFFVLPGVWYWAWRRSVAREACPACRQPGLIPTDSPFGFALGEKASQHRRDANIAGLAPDSRIERIEQAVDAIAVEVERLAETQRYAAKMLGQSK